MSTVDRHLIISCAAVAAVATSASAQQELEQLEAIAVVEQKVMVPMRDGVRLATDVYRPKAGGRVPAIFVRTPYNFNPWRDGELQTRRFRPIIDAVERGYAYVIQNERGRYFSEGEWDILGPPKTDGYDALTWIAEQPWSNGKVGTLGCSSTAEWQMGLAALDHPAHAAMVPQGFGAGVGRVGGFYEQGNWYRGGAEQMLFFTWLYGVQNTQRPMFPENIPREDMIRLSRYFDLAPEMPPVDWKEALWHLPVEDIMRNVDGPKGIFADSAPVATGGRMIQRTPDDSAWYKGGLYHDDEPFGVPSMWFMSWYDVSVGPNLALFNHVRNSAEDPEVAQSQYAVIAPVTHCAYTRASEQTIVGERNMGDARLDYDALIYAWWDYWLKGENNGITDTLPKVRYYTMGMNQWQTAESWPPAGVEIVTHYLNSGGNANTVFGDGELTTRRPGSRDNPDSFTYDPGNPVMSYGGNVCCIGGAIDAGAFDQQEMEQRPDILVYTTEPLEQGIEVSGTIEITLYVSSDAKDTDFTVKLLDVYPDGTAYNLDETVQRARYREGYDKQVFMEEGVVYELAVSPMSTSNYFAAGHRIRIEVSSSNFPRFTRNLNTGGRNYDETEWVVAHNQVHHSRDYPSQIRLPVVRR
ncbi:MAG: CocE/NonD family hydrolase [Gemmatimonadota bacterium]|nr:MAG: CocE/NonD family hydrolase [Gemmatimonadota bacterium]